MANETKYDNCYTFVYANDGAQDRTVGSLKNDSIFKTNPPKFFYVLPEGDIAGQNQLQSWINVKLKIIKYVTGTTLKNEDLCTIVQMLTAKYAIEFGLIKVPFNP